MKRPSLQTVSGVTRQFPSVLTKRKTSGEGTTTVKEVVGHKGPSTGDGDDVSVVAT